MKHTFLLIASLLAALITAPAAQQAGRVVVASPWENSVVTLEIARKQYDYYQPWSKPTKRLQKVGTVIGDHQILTTADEMFDRTLIRLQKGGRGRWWIGEVSWIDYYANLAVVTTTNSDFWTGLKPVGFASVRPAKSALQILRWREGNLESRRGEFTQFAVREGQLASVSHVTLEVSSDIQGAGWGEPITTDSHLAAIISSQNGRNCMAIPCSFFRSILDARKQKSYHGLGFFHFYWEPALDPEVLSWLKLPGEPRGVVVTDVPDRPDGGEHVIKRLDVILQIDGFNLDTQGDYNDPEFGHVMLENLSTRNKWAGDDVKLQIWRDARKIDVTYRLPKFDYSNFLVPAANYDKEPEYLIVGGLVFQPLTDSYLQSWGPEWKRRSPFRLQYYRNEPPTKNRPALVILSQVLPDPYNIGYQSQNYLVVDKVNGQTISRLPDLRAALQKPQNGFHVLEFVRSDSLRRIILAAGEPEQAATTRILKRYGVTEPFHFATEPTD